MDLGMCRIIQSQYRDSSFSNYNIGKSEMVNLDVW